MTTTIPENIKKTATLTYTTISTLLEDGKIDQSAFDVISSTLTKIIGKSKASGEKVLHFLFDSENEVIGRYCNVTHKWYEIDRFAPKSGRVKEMDVLMKKEYTRVSKIKQEAEALFVTLTQADPSEKLELLTQYEEMKENAQPILPTSEELEGVEGGFESVEELAEDLGVEVILEKTED